MGNIDIVHASWVPDRLPGEASVDGRLDIITVCFYNRYAPNARVLEHYFTRVVKHRDDQDRLESTWWSSGMSTDWIVYAPTETGLIKVWSDGFPALSTDLRATREEALADRDAWLTRRWEPQFKWDGKPRAQRF